MLTLKLSSTCRFLGHTVFIYLRLTCYSATLLLARSPLQVKNQQRLESYLSESSQAVVYSGDRIEASIDDSVEWQAHLPVRSGTDTPRDLSSRIKILELYTLHVLPRNEEWQYAEEFIAMSELLGEDTREIFSQTLQRLQAKKNRDVADEATILEERDNNTEQHREPTEDRKLDAPLIGQYSPGTDKASGSHRKSNSEKDYGIEGLSTVDGETKPRNHVDPKTPQSPHLSRTKFSPTIRPSSIPKRPATKSVYTRSVAMLVTFQHIMLNLTRSMSQTPMILLRTIIFLAGVILAFSRRDVRDRISRITGIGWEKVRGTVGMGVKVSYI